MSNPANIRTAIASALATGLPAWSVSQYWRAKPEPPQIDMMLGPINYDLAMQGGNEDISFVIRATVQQAEDGNQGSLDALVDWTSSSSLKGVLEADRTLGGVVSSLRVSDVTEMKLFPTEGGFMPGVEFNVEIVPNG